MKRELIEAIRRAIAFICVEPESMELHAHFNSLFLRVASCDMPRVVGRQGKHIHTFIKLAHRAGYERGIVCHLTLREPVVVSPRIVPYVPPNPEYDPTPIAQTLGELLPSVRWDLRRDSTSWCLTVSRTPIDAVIATWAETSAKANGCCLRVKFSNAVKSAPVAV